jgi:effector-binding domain-containing protein
MNGMIETGREFYAENLISLRKKGTQAEINSAATALNEYIKSQSAGRAGPSISTTYSVDQSGGQAVLDMEILIPVDRNIEQADGYVFKKKFHLVNAAYIRHEGRPEQLQEACSRLIKYLQENKLQNITSINNVMIKEPQNINGTFGDMIVDLYIGINPSIL